jgi:hypothetical protein
MKEQNELCSFFNNSAKRQGKLTQVLQLSSDVHKTKLCTLSQTRWLEGKLQIFYFNFDTNAITFV